MVIIVKWYKHMKNIQEETIQFSTINNHPRSHERWDVAKSKIKMPNTNKQENPIKNQKLWNKKATIFVYKDWKQRNVKKIKKCEIHHHYYYLINHESLFSIDINLKIKKTIFHFHGQMQLNKGKIQSPTSNQELLLEFSQDKRVGRQKGLRFQEEQNGWKWEREREGEGILWECKKTSGKNRSWLWKTGKKKRLVKLQGLIASKGRDKSVCEATSFVHYNLSH